MSSDLLTDEPLATRALPIVNQLRHLLSGKDCDVLEVIQGLIDLVGYILLADKTEDHTVNDFLQGTLLPLFLDIIRDASPIKIKSEIYQSLSKILTNIKSQNILRSLLSNDQLNLLIQLPVDVYNYELLSFYMNMLRALSSKITLENIGLFFSKDVNTYLPILRYSTRFFHYPDHLVGTAARTTILNVLRCRKQTIVDFISGEKARLTFFHDLACYLSALCLDIAMASYATSLRSAAMSSSTSTDSKTFTDNIPVSILLSASKEFQSPLTQARYRVLFGEESPRCTDDDNPYVSPKGPPPDFKPPTISLDDLIFNFTDTLSFLQDVYRHTSLQVTLSATRQLMEHFVLPLGRHFWRLCAFAVTPDQEETLSTSPYADVTKTPREGVISVDREEPDSLFTSPSTHLHQAPLSKLSSILKDGKDPASHASTKRIKFGYTSTPLNIVDYIKTPSDTISPSSTKPFETQCFVDWITAGMKDWSEPPVVLGIPTSLCLFYFTCLITNSLPIVFPFAVSACLYFGEKPFTSIVLNNPRSVLQPFTLLVTQPDAIDFLCPSIIQYNSLYLFSIHVADGKRALLDRNRDARSSRLKVTQRRRAEQESLHKGFLSGKDNVSMKEDNMKETNHIKIRQMAQFVSPLSHQLLQLEESCGNVFDVPSPLFGLFGLDIPTTLGMHKKIIDAERAAEMDGIKPIEDEPVDCDIITNLTMLSEEDSNRVMMLEEADWKKKWEKQLQTQMKKKQAHLTKSTKHQRPIDKSTSFVQIMSHFRINEMSKQSPKVELLLQPLKNDRTHLLHAILDSPLFASLRQQKTDPAFTFSLDNLSYSSLILAAVFFFTNEIYTTTSDKIFTLLSIYLAKG